MSDQILFRCSACDFLAHVSNELGGHELGCEKCGERSLVPEQLPTLRREARERARRKRKAEDGVAIPPLALLAATGISGAAGYAWYELELQNMGGHTWLAILTGLVIGWVLRRLGARPGSAWWIAIVLTVAPFIAAKYKLTDWDRLEYASEQMAPMWESGTLENMYRAEHQLSQEPPAAIPDEDFSKWVNRYVEELIDSYPADKLLLDRLGPEEVLLLVLSAGAALVSLLSPSYS